MNPLLGKILTLKCRINETVIKEVAYAVEIKPEEVTIEHIREQCKSDIQDEFISLEVE